MRTYKIRISQNAHKDIREMYHYIAYILCAPITGTAYKRGVLDTIYQLASYGASIAPSLNDYIQRHYGPDARTVLYKKMTIVFNVRNDMIIIRRVMPGNLIL